MNESAAALERQKLAMCLSLACSVLVSCDSPTDGPNPIPVLLSLSPETVVLGGPSPAVQVTGHGFVRASRVHLNGVEKQTSFVSSDQLTLQLTSDDIVSGGGFVSGGTFEVSIVNPAPGGGESGVRTLTVVFAVPTITSISPTSAPAGSDAVTLTVDGTGFVKDATGVLFIGPLVTTFVNSTRLTAVIPAADLASGGVIDVRVANPGVSVSAESRPFSIGHPLPSLTSVSPTPIVGGRPTRVSVVGQGFTSSSQVWLEGGTYVSQVVSPAFLYADLPAFGAPDTVAVGVMNAGPGGGLSNTMSVIVTLSAPRITGFTPAFAQSGDAGFALTVHGEHFTSGSTLFWDGVQRASAFVNDSTITVSVVDSDLVEPGAAGVRVVAEGRESLTVGFPVVAAAVSVTDSFTVAITNRDLVAHPNEPVIYLAVPSFAPQYANEAVALDATSGELLWHTPAGNDPWVIRVSDDGAYLYVGLDDVSSISRINVASQAKDLDIPLPTGLRAEDIVVLPGQPTTIAVSLRNPSSAPKHDGVAIYDEAVERPQRTPGHTGSNRIEPGPTPARLYGLNNESSEYGFRRILVGASGALPDGAYSGLVDESLEITYDGGLVFGSTGRVVEPESRAQLGTIPGSGPLRPDVANGRVHRLSGASLTTYQFASFAPLGSITLPTTGLLALVRYGPDGLAFGGGGRVFFFRSTLIGS